MIRQGWLGVRLLALSVALVVSCFGGARFAVADPPKPNIVVIMSDDGAYNDYGFSAALHNVSRPNATPNIDALAQQSVVASQAYVADPVCTPSRAGLLTGQYVQRFGVEDVLGNAINSSDTWGLTADSVTIAQRLKNLGYSTGTVGKWHVGHTTGLNRPNDVGFDESYSVLGGGRTYFYDPNTDRAMYKNNVYYEEQFRVEGDWTKYEPPTTLPAVLPTNAAEAVAKGYRRYVTDAFGEESSNFISSHANSANPFFLYTAFDTPHDPIQSKLADIKSLYPNVTTPTTEQTRQGMLVAMDRAVAQMIDSLKDPNHDGNQSDSVYDNTIIVLLNDNGSPLLVGDSVPFRGYKGTQWEGGIRTPFLIKAPGLTPGQYDNPITAYDVLPTLVNAAGGDASQFPTDGHDLMPYLKGTQSGAPNDVLYFREQDTWAVRQGNWKLTGAFFNTVGPFLYDLSTDIGETTNLIVSRPDIANPMWRLYTNWAAQMTKPKFGPLSTPNQNEFDHFVFRNDVASTNNWSAASVWLQGGTANIKTMNPADGYANCILEFGVRNDANYTSNNDLDGQVKISLYMLNQLRFTGDFTGTADRQGALTGKKLLLVKNLAQQLPQLRFDATSSGTANKFTYTIGNELQLLDNLEITGNGTQNFVINSAIKDYWDPRSVTKTGSSLVTLGGASTFKGTLTVNGGTLRLAGASASMNGPSSIIVGAAGNFTLDNGVVTVPTIDTSSGGLFNLNGGTLKVVNVTGNLANSGGVFSPGASPALSTISGNFTQTAGSLLMELGGTDPGVNFDQLVIGGAANLGGILTVQLINGFSPTLNQTFNILHADGGINGLFTIGSFPALPGNFSWRVLYSANNLTLQIGPPGGTVIISPPGDYNQDGKVDAADYTRWRDTLGSTTSLAADGNGNGSIDQGDYDVWKNHFGESSPGAGHGSNTAAAPEPASIALLFLTSTLFSLIRRR